jgi:hypothetical protein
MRSDRVHRARRLVPWISALIVLGGTDPHTPSRSALPVVHVEHSVARVQATTPDTVLATRPRDDARRQHRLRLLEWAIQLLRVLDAVLQAMRVLLR